MSLQNDLYLLNAYFNNSIEFWSNDIGFGLKDGESKKLTSKDGKSEFLIIKASDGFTVRRTSGTGDLEASFRYNEFDMTWYYQSEKESIKLAQMVTGPNGNFVRVFKPDGTSTIVDASLRDVEEIRAIIKRPSLAL